MADKGRVQIDVGLIQEVAKEVIKLLILKIVFLYIET